MGNEGDGMNEQGIKLTAQCISLEKQMVQLRDAIAHGDWEKAREILDRIGDIAEGE